MLSISAWPLFSTTGCDLSSSIVTNSFDEVKDDTEVVLFVAEGFVGGSCVPSERTSNFGTGLILAANRTRATGVRIFVSMVSALSELLFGSERWLSNVVVLGLAALLSSDAAMFEGLATPSRIESALLFLGAALSDGSVPPSSTVYAVVICVCFFSRL